MEFTHPPATRCIHSSRSAIACSLVQRVLFLSLQIFLGSILPFYLSNWWNIFFQVYNLSTNLHQTHLNVSEIYCRVSVAVQACPVFTCQQYVPHWVFLPKLSWAGWLGPGRLYLLSWLWVKWIFFYKSRGCSKKMWLFHSIHCTVIWA